MSACGLAAAAAAICAAQRVHLCTVIGNYFRGQQYESGAVIDNMPRSGANSVNNFIGNAVDTGGPTAPTRAQILTNPAAGADGWEILP